MANIEDKEAAWERYREITEGWRKQGILVRSPEEIAKDDEKFRKKRQEIGSIEKVSKSETNNGPGQRDESRYPEYIGINEGSSGGRPDDYFGY